LRQHGSSQSSASVALSDNKRYNLRQHRASVALPFYLFWWDDETVEHLAEHGVSPEQFEEIVQNPVKVEFSRSSDRPGAFGWDDEGRYLYCVYEMIDETTVLPITAFEVEV
jgi:uncharacterized DUF497 family protein